VTAYQVGRAFEHKTRDHLRSEGYEVTRAAGSKTKLDLIALKPGQLLFVQDGP
jgi:Holliday junction resolvase